MGLVARTNETIGIMQFLLRIKILSNFLKGLLIKDCRDFSVI
jgi:hypothetical protein